MEMTCRVLVVVEGVELEYDEVVLKRLSLFFFFVVADWALRYVIVVAARVRAEAEGWRG